MKNITNLKTIICSAKYLTKYEPILDVNSLEIFAYEALSQFDIKDKSISTEDVFKELHHNNNLFFTLEQRNKKLQIENFNMNTKLFLNFDADIFITDKQKKYWQSFFEPLKDNIVVEITENGSDDEKSSKIMHNFSLWLIDNKIETALDDFAQDGTMFSFKLMNESKYIKIDKSFIKQIRSNKNYIHYLKGLVKTISENGKKVIIEGIETLDDLTIAKEVKCDFVQGYLFKDKTVIK